MRYRLNRYRVLSKDGDQESKPTWWRADLPDVVEAANAVAALESVGATGAPWKNSDYDAAGAGDYYHIDAVRIRTLPSYKRDAGEPCIFEDSPWQKSCWGQVKIVDYVTYEDDDDEVPDYRCEGHADDEYAESTKPEDLGGP